MWAAPGKDQATLRTFFDALEASGEGRCAEITHVSADGASWIAQVVAERCSNAVRCADPFHVVKVRHEALCVRVGVRDPHRLVVAAAGLKSWAAARNSDSDQLWVSGCLLLVPVLVVDLLWGAVAEC